MAGGMEGSILVRGTMLPGRLSAGAIHIDAPSPLDVLFQSILHRSLQEITVTTSKCLSSTRGTSLRTTFVLSYNEGAKISSACLGANIPRSVRTSKDTLKLNIGLSTLHRFASLSNHFKESEESDPATGAKNGYGGLGEGIRGRCNPTNFQQNGRLHA